MLPWGSPRASRAPRFGALVFGVVLGTLALVALASACGSNGARPGAPPSGSEGGVDAPPSGQDGGNDDDAADAAPDWLVPPPIQRDAGEATLAPLRQACAFEAGAWAAETLGSELPIGADIPINHVIVIVQENRSFDHYLGRLVAQGYYEAGDFTQVPDGGGDAGSASDAADGATSDGGDAGGPPATDGGGAVPGSGFSNSNQLDVPPPGWHNLDTDGGIVVPRADDLHCYDVDHSWEGQHFDWDKGKNDGFVVWNAPGGERTLFYEDDTVIPFYYALANAFSVGDRYFSSVIGPTWPNRYFLMAGTSFGIGDDHDFVTVPVPQIFTLLEAGGHSWKDYTDGPHMEVTFFTFGLTADTLSHYGSVECTLLGDIENGTLPDVSFVDGDEQPPQDSDEGPSALPGIGGQLVETIIRALWSSGSWKDTAVFITYDENGGIADHVPPAPACEPDGYPAHDVNNNPLSGKFDTTGFRVPFIVVSPYAKPHFASHVVHDHTSILRFIEARFGLPALTARDANATPPMEVFDFAHPAFLAPPTIAPSPGSTLTTTVPPAILAACQQTLAPLTCTAQ